MNIDLNPARAARMEKAPEKHTLTIGKEKFDLPRELPVAFGEALARVVVRLNPETKQEENVLAPDVLGAARSVLNGQMDRFLAVKFDDGQVGPSYDDLAEFVNNVGEALAGKTEGESKASRSSSKRTSKSSRPASKRSTT